MKMTLQTNLSRVLAIFLLLLFLLLGFYRYVITVEIGLFFSKIFSSALFLTSHQSKNLSLTVFVSWLDTLIYSMIYLLLLLGVVYFWFQNIQYVYLSFAFIIALLFISFIVLVIHKLSHHHIFYRISEDLIYFVLSPTPLLLLSIFFYLAKSIKKQG